LAGEPNSTIENKTLPADPDQHLQDYQAAKPAMDAEDRCG
jgi:hypothetical protein